MAEIMGYKDEKSVIVDVIHCEKGKYLHVLEKPVSTLYGYAPGGKFSFGWQLRCFGCEEEVIENCKLYEIDDASSLTKSFYLQTNERKILIRAIHEKGLLEIIQTLNTKNKKLELENKELRSDIELYRSTKEFIEEARVLSK